MFWTMTQVALGAAIGGAARFGMGAGILRAFGQTGFPFVILTINVLGSFLMGLYVVWSMQKGLAAWNPFVMTGVLGGFTTFSAFSLETVTLIERGQLGFAASYVLGSVILSVGALFGGVVVARGMLA